MMSRTDRTSNRTARKRPLFARNAFFLLAAAVFTSPLLAGCAFNHEADPETAAVAASQSTVKATAENRAVLEKLSGTWLAPVPGQVGNDWGYVFEPTGEARTVNAATLRVKRWSLDAAGKRLTIEGDSIGNGMTIPFIRIFEVESVDDTTLVLLNGTLRETFRRAPDAGAAKEPAERPATDVGESATDSGESRTTLDTLDMLENP